MKILILLVTLITVTFFGCGGGDNGTSSKDSPFENEGQFDTTITNNKGQFVFSGTGGKVTRSYERALNFDYERVLFTLTLQESFAEVNDSNYIAFYSYNAEDKDTTHLLYKKGFNVNGTITLDERLRLKEVPQKIVISLHNYSGVIEVTALEVAGSL